MRTFHCIKVLAFAKFQAILMAFIGLVAGILYALSGLIIDILVSIEWITHPETPGLSLGTILALGALIGMPIIFAIAGFIVGVIQATLYNFYVKMVWSN